MKHMTKQELWEEKVRIAARRNREIMEKMFLKKKPRKEVFNPFVQYAQPTKK